MNIEAHALAFSTQPGAAAAGGAPAAGMDMASCLSRAVVGSDGPSLQLPPCRHTATVVGGHFCPLGYTPSGLR